MNKTSAILQSLGFSYGQTECYFPNNAKPFSLVAMLKDTLMRNLFLLFLLTYSMTVVGQKVEYRNDSLFVNNYFVDASTSKITLDSLLQTSGKTKVSKDKDKKNAVTNKQVKITTHFYYNLGLFFRTYDNDTTQLSIGIKLYRATDRENYEEQKLTETFKGQLIIADNLINDKRQIGQLEKLDNCSVTITKGRIGSYSSILWGDIIYQQNVIRLMFDVKTNELTTVYIHHNFKDR